MIERREMPRVKYIDGMKEDLQVAECTDSEIEFLSKLERLNTITDRMLKRIREI